MIRAFFSHSSVDKEIVRNIKNHLHRIWTYFDEDCFEAGEDFREAIVTRIENAKLFVLFASKHSIKSSWVKFELDEAFWQKVKRNNISFLVLTLDDVGLDQIPSWMRKAKFESVSSPKIAAQKIRTYLLKDTVINAKVYIGREKDTSKLFEDINNLGTNFPNIIALIGLNGIGRRTFASDVLKRRFSLDYNSEVSVKRLGRDHRIIQKIAGR